MVEVVLPNLNRKQKIMKILEIGGSRRKYPQKIWGLLKFSPGPMKFIFCVSCVCIIYLFPFTFVIFSHFAPL